jgi:AcrR family transcriptional regulator
VATYARLSVEERRERLIDLGTRLFSTRAYDEISIEEIAQAAGMSKGLLYHYFASKRDFYVACVRQSSIELRNATSPDPRLAPRAQMRVGLKAYLDLVQANLARSRAFVSGGIGADPEVTAITEETRRINTENVLRGIDARDDERLLRIGVRAWISFAEIAAIKWAEAGGGDQAELIDILLAALAAIVRRSRAPAARRA